MAPICFSRFPLTYRLGLRVAVHLMVSPELWRCCQFPVTVCHTTVFFLRCGKQSGSLQACIRICPSAMASCSVYMLVCSHGWLLVYLIQCGAHTLRDIRRLYL